MEKEKAEGKEDVTGPDPSSYEDLPPGNFTVPYYNGGYRNYGDHFFPNKDDNGLGGKGGNFTNNIHRDNQVGGYNNRAQSGQYKNGYYKANQNSDQQSNNENGSHSGNNYVKSNYGNGNGFNKYNNSGGYNNYKRGYSNNYGDGNGGYPKKQPYGQGY